MFAIKKSNILWDSWLSIRNLFDTISNMTAWCFSDFWNTVYKYVWINNAGRVEAYNKHECDWSIVTMDECLERLSQIAFPGERFNEEYLIGNNMWCVSVSDLKSLDTPGSFLSYNSFIKAFKDNCMNYKEFDNLMEYDYIWVDLKWNVMWKDSVFWKQVNVFWATTRLQDILQNKKMISQDKNNINSKESSDNYYPIKADEIFIDEILLDESSSDNIPATKISTSKSNIYKSYNLF